MCLRPISLVVILASLLGSGALLYGLDQARTARWRAISSKARIAILDDLGQAVALSRPAQRIAALSPSNIESLFALGCGGKVVLRDRVSAYPPAAARLPATNPFQVSAEHVAGYAPDLVLLSHADLGQATALRRLGLPVATFDPRNLEGVYANIAAIGLLCGAEARAHKLVEELRARVRQATARVRGRPRPLVYIETDGSDPLKPWTAGPGSFVHELVSLAGGRNLASHLGRPYAQVNVEEVFVRQPDVILLMGMDQLTKGRALAALRTRPGWGELRAVREGRVIDAVDSDLLSRPGPRLIEGLEALAQALHPEARP